MIPVLVFLLVSGLVTGGASVAAENSLPGDLLYPIKVGMNEKVGAALAGSAEAKADFDTKIALRRVMEAERLSVKGNVSADVMAQLESNFRARAERVADRVAEFETDGKLDVALKANSNFQSSLDAHEGILVRLASGDKDASNKARLAGFSAKVRSAVSSSKALHAGIEAKMRANGTQSSAEGKLGAAQNKIAEVRNFLDSKGDSVSAEVKVRAEARLTEANSAVAQGKIKIEAQAYGEAFVLFQRAHRLAQEAQMTINGNIDINLRILNAVDRVNSDRNDNENDESGAEAEVDVNAGASSNNSGTNVNGSVNVEVGL